MGIVSILYDVVMALIILVGIVAIGGVVLLVAKWLDP